MWFRNTSLNKALGKTLYRRLHMRGSHDFVRLSNIFPRMNEAGTSLPLDAKDKDCKSYKLMLQSHLITKDITKGTFTMSPHMTRSLEKLYKVIDREMQQINAQKMAMPIIAHKEEWKNGGRWDVMGSELITFQDRKSVQHCLAPTHEEAVTRYMTQHMVHENHLPVMLYQIGRKFRDEMRPRFGLLRCREFEMKDLYSFDADEEHAKVSYDNVASAYSKIFERLGLDIVRVAADSGAMGGSVSHEYHLISPIGEDMLFKCNACDTYSNAEVINKEQDNDAALLCPNCNSESMSKHAGIELAHAFMLGYKYSQAYKAMYVSGTTKKPYYMGCYGIGVTRLIAAALEVLSTKDTIRWPKVIAPYQIAVIPYFQNNKKDGPKILADAVKLCNTLKQFSHLHREILLIDSKLTAHKLSLQAMGLGIPHIIYVDPKNLTSCNPKYEYYDVYQDKRMVLSEHELMGIVSNIDTVVL